MEEMQMGNTILLRRDTKANWNQVNPILKDGEAGFEMDDGKMKIGDGVHNWNDLPYTNEQKVTYEDKDGNEFHEVSKIKFEDSTAHVDPNNPNELVVGKDSQLPPQPVEFKVYFGFYHLDSISSIAAKQLREDTRTSPYSEFVAHQDDTPNYFYIIMPIVEARKVGKVSQEPSTLGSSWNKLATISIDGEDFIPIRSPYKMFDNNVVFKTSK